MYKAREHNPQYGRGVVSVDTLDFIDEAEVKSRLLETFRAATYRPPQLPAVALEVMRLSQQHDVSFADVSQVLERDSMMTGQVIKVAQSSALGGRTRITSIRDAMVRLGLGGVRDIVLQVAVNARVFRSKQYGPAMSSLRRHSVAVAQVCRTLCKYSPLDGEFAFLCGLMHDVGVAGSLIALSERAPKGSAPSVDMVWPAIMAVHEEASEIMAKVWEMPADVSMVLAAHHRITIQGYPHPMAATIALAENIANGLGLGLQMNPAGAGAHPRSDEPELAPVRVKELQQIIGLTDAQLDLVAEETTALGEQLGDI